MQIDWWTLALQTINFSILVWLLHRFLYKPVLRAIDARRADREKQDAQAREAEAQAQTKLAEAVAEREGIAAERAAALKAAAAQGEEAAAARRLQAEREAAGILEQTRKSLAVERDEAVAEVRRMALDLGIEVARRLLDEIPASLRAEAWLERVEEHLAGLDPAKREEILKELNGGATIRIITALSLPEPQMAEWRVRLDRALGDHASVEFEVDPSLIAGTELHFPNAVLRFSWRSSLAAIRETVEIHEDAR